MIDLASVAILETDLTVRCLQRGIADRPRVGRQSFGNLLELGLPSELAEERAFLLPDPTSVPPVVAGPAHEPAPRLYWA